MNPTVTVITGTINNRLLLRCLKSVQDQTYGNIQHLIMVDGPDHGVGVTIKKHQCGTAKEIDVIYLPYNTGKDRYNAHRILAAGVYLAKGDLICLLDDDNYLEPTHIEDCVNTWMGKMLDWCFAYRKIVDKEGNFLCKDECESLGNRPSVCGPDDYFVDVNCYFLPKPLALALTPIMHRKFREPGQMEIDRAMVHALRQMKTKYAPTGNYTVNYTVGNSNLSVQAEFFIKGNEIMHQGGQPWHK